MLKVITWLSVFMVSIHSVISVKPHDTHTIVQVHNVHNDAYVPQSPVHKVITPNTPNTPNKPNKPCNWYDINCDVKHVEKDIEKDVKHIKHDLKPILETEKTIGKDINNGIKKIKQAMMVEKDVQFVIKLIKDGKNIARESWIDAQKATKMISHTLDKISSVIDVVSIVSDDILSCMKCSPVCDVCKIGVDEMINMGEEDGCGIVVPAVCETIGLGPEDPLSDICAVGMGIVCSKLENKLLHGLSSHQLCSSIHIC